MKKFFIPILVVSLSVAAILAFVLLSKNLSKRMRPASKISSSSDTAINPVQKSAAPLVKKPNQVIPRPPASADQQAKMIGEIKKDLQAVLDLNQTINAVHQSKSVQLLRIEEQAQIHQRILAEIQKGVAVKPQMPSREALLNQEKLRIIREETLRNKKLLEETTSKPVS